jgi:adenine-specific DNA-methyltransferase
MQLNAEDGGNRKYIMVQIPEKTEEDSEAYKAGYKYISDISKERIRRVGKKILEENKEELAKREKPLDVGFRAYKADTTNMKDVYYHPSQVVQEDLFNLVSNIKEDRTPEDLLTQVILDLGLTLDLVPLSKLAKRHHCTLITLHTVYRKPLTT